MLGPERLCKEMNVPHRKMLPVLCPQFEIVKGGGCSDQGIAQFYCMTGMIRPKIVAGSPADLNVNRHRGHGRKYSFDAFFLSVSHAMTNLGERNRGVEDRCACVHSVRPQPRHFCVSSTHHFYQDVGIDQNAAHLESRFSRSPFLRLRI